MIFKLSYKKRYACFHITPYMKTVMHIRSTESINYGIIPLYETSSKFDGNLACNLEFFFVLS